MSTIRGDAHGWPVPCPEAGDRPAAPTARARGRGPSAGGGEPAVPGGFRTRAARGIAGTIVTSDRGVLAPLPLVARKSLLGE